MYSNIFYRLCVDKQLIFTYLVVNKYFYRVVSVTDFNIFRQLAIHFCRPLLILSNNHPTGVSGGVACWNQTNLKYTLFSIVCQPPFFALFTQIDKSLHALAPTWILDRGQGSG